MYLEHVVNASDGRLTLHGLEAAFPYALLRENYSQLDEKQNPHIVSYISFADDEKE